MFPTQTYFNQTSLFPLNLIDAALVCEKQLFLDTCVYGITVRNRTNNVML